MRGITSTAFVTLKEFLDLVLVKEERWERGEESKANGKRRHAHLIHWEAPQWCHPPWRERPAKREGWPSSSIQCEPYSPKTIQFEDERREKKMRNKWHSLSNTSWSEGMSHKTSGNTSKRLYDKAMTCSSSRHPPSTPHTRWINKKEDTRRSKKNEEKKKK